MLRSHLHCEVETSGRHVPVIALHNVHLAARYSRGASEQVLGPPPIKPLVRALQAYTALGAPAESIRALEGAVWKAAPPGTRPSDPGRVCTRSIGGDSLQEFIGNRRCSFVSPAGSPRHADI